MIVCISWYIYNIIIKAELNKILSILVANGYPNHIITSIFTEKIQQFNQPSQHGPKKCPVYFHLPWLGTVSINFEKQITTAIQRWYFAVGTLVVFTTRPLFPSTKKDVLPAHHHNNIIYQFVCHCDSRCVKRTSQSLQERIWQHAFRSIRNHHSSQYRSNFSCACKTNRASQIIAHDSLNNATLAPKDRFANVYVDITGPPGVSNGCSYLLVVIDRFSQFMNAIPLIGIRQRMC